MSRKAHVALLLGWSDPRLVRGIGRFAREAGWHLSMRNIFDGAMPRRLRADGILTSRWVDPAANTTIAALMRRIPAVLIGANPIRGRRPDIVEDDLGAGRLAARHLMERGHRHFVWFSPYPGAVEDLRHRGFRAAIGAAGGTCTVLRWFGRPQAGRDWHRRLLATLRGLPRPVALLALDDQLAADVIGVCLDGGLRVPEDVSVMGIGNMELICDCSHVPVTSVDLDSEAIGYQAAAMLGRRMADGRAPPAATLVVPVAKVIERRSTGLLAVQDATVLKAVRFIDDQHHRPIGPADVAGACGLSLRGLEAAFSRTLRRSPAKYLLAVRLAQAQRLIAERGCTIQQVATACGFGTVRSLNRCFHRCLGASPRTWRQAARAAGGKGGDRGLRNQ